MVLPVFWVYFRLLDLPVLSAFFYLRIVDDMIKSNIERKVILCESVIRHEIQPKKNPVKVLPAPIQGIRFTQGQPAIKVIVLIFKITVTGYNIQHFSVNCNKQYKNIKYHFFNKRPWVFLKRSTDGFFLLGKTNGGDEMINPILKIKNERNLTNRQIAILLNQSVGNVSHLLNGDFNYIPEKTLKVFERFGYDPDIMQREYKAFRSEQREKITQKMGAVI